MSTTSPLSKSSFRESRQPSLDVIDLNLRLSQLFDLREHCNEDQQITKGFIQHCFQSAYGATITNFMPRLFSLRTNRHELIAAFGLRPAKNERLFLESYLNGPIEVVMRSRLGKDVNREDVIEVGNLSALYPGASRWVIVALTALLHNEGYKWVVFTGTSTLRNGFTRLGLRPVELGKASIDVLPPQSRRSWGTYYENTPVVLSGEIDLGYASLMNHQNLSDLLRMNLDSIEAL